MKWKCYKLVYKVFSPVHIGYRKLGIIQQTRYYIPGKVIWGCLTSNFTRIFYSTPNIKNYESVGKLMKTKILPSYFFPSLEMNVDNVFIPRFTENGLKYKDVSLYEFEKIFISSFIQTAINTSTFTSEDKTLHETEFFIPHSKGENSKQVFFIGHIFMQNDIKYKNKTIGWNSGDLELLNILEQIFAGGERTYGFGRMKLQKKMSCEVSKLFEYQLSLQNDLPKVRVGPKEQITAHLEINKFKDVLYGDIEPLVGREWSKEKGAGRKLSKAKICYVPGTTIERETTFNIGEHGIWFV